MNEGVMKNSCSKGSPRVVEKQRKRLNQRQKARILLIFSVAFLAVTAILGVVLHDAAMVTDFSRKNIAPCLKYPFGTDWLGRNMFYRTLTGLSMSILIGVLAAGVSAVMALILGICAATLGKKVDSAISFAIDTVMGIPHILLVFPLYWRKETESSSISSIFFLFVQLIFFHTLLSLTGQSLLLFSICEHFPDPEADEELYRLFQTAQP